ncbi:MAG: non-canonical purine NTP diphosphatase [Flavobacteriaceae bacterium]|nr:non-canonical purine NTP diphosphatase [Flavobacteriaceae bacterium]
MEIVFATHNQNKLKEVQQLLPSHIKLLSLEDIGCFEEIEETGDTLEENAWIKANYVYHTYGKACFADDTGLEVKALNGAPGVYSARYAGEEKDTSANMQKLLVALSQEQDRTAQFRTAIALRLSDQKKLFEGIVKGSIANKMEGKNGFGYDPIFIPEKYEKSFGLLDASIKNKISHRARAIHKLVEHLGQSL